MSQEGRKDEFGGHARQGVTSTHSRTILHICQPGPCTNQLPDDEPARDSTLQL
jgi:hypothetical protein